MNDDDEDTVAKLLRMAGRRPPIEAERMARVRDAVRGEWEHDVRRRRLVRFTAAAAVLAAAVAGVLLLVQQTATRSVPADGIQLVARLVETSAGEYRSLSWNGATVRLDGDTRVLLDERGAATLERGAIYYSSDDNPSQVTIRTPLGEVRDIGTQFEVRVGPESLRVRVREGAVTLRGTTASAGTELTAAATDIARRPIAVSGDEWAWVERAAPPIRLEGRTLGAVIDQVAREKGLRVRWSGAARDVVLHGDVPLTVDEALEAATGAAGVSYRIAGGELEIAR